MKIYFVTMSLETKQQQIALFIAYQVMNYDSLNFVNINIKYH